MSSLDLNFDPSAWNMFVYCINEWFYSLFTTFTQLFFCGEFSSFCQKYFWKKEYILSQIPFLKKKHLPKNFTIFATNFVSIWKNETQLNWCIHFAWVMAQWYSPCLGPCDILKRFWVQTHWCAHARAGEKAHPNFVSFRAWLWRCPTACQLPIWRGTFTCCSTLEPSSFGILLKPMLVGYWIFFKYPSRWLFENFNFTQK
jgi:hypothetical protein